MSVLGGALSYRKSTNSFFINETGTNDGWVPLRYSLKGSDLTDSDVNELIDRIGGSNSAQLFVDINNPRASDSKDNKGTSKLRPFRSIERALLEASRRSFRIGAPDIYERTSIVIAPGEYNIYNGPGQLIEDFEYYDEFQAATRLILRNREWIVEQAFALIPAFFKSDETRADLKYMLNSMVNDVSLGGNFYTVNFSRNLVNSDTEINCSESGYFIPAYSDIDYRQVVIQALERVEEFSLKAVLNQGVWIDAQVNIQNGSLVYSKISAAVNTALSLFQSVLDCSTDPRYITIDTGKINRQNIPENGEIDGRYFQSFNSPVHPGVILPRGVSLVGEDLRKVVIKPRYVPNPTDPEAKRASIFRMTGGNFITNLTVKDAVNYSESHHKLSVFSFVTENDLELYYNSVNLSFADKSIYHRAQDAANLLDWNIDWIAKKSIPKVVPSGFLNYAKIFEAEIYHFIISISKDLKSLSNENSIKFGERFFISHLLNLPGDIRESVNTYYKELFEISMRFVYDAIRNEANESEGGFIDRFITPDNNIQNGRCANIISAVNTYKDIIFTKFDGLDTEYPKFAEKTPLGDSEAFPAETEIVAPISVEESNRVSAASPYIFSVSVRSKFGLCGVDGDGSKVTGFKSFLAAQFTIISLQTDIRAFISDESEVGGNRYKGSKADDETDWRHFGYRVSNSAYSQLVSCFCIGPAIHYWADGGSEFSITNSTSNFGDISLFASGFVDNGQGGGAYPQDRGYDLISIKKPEFFNPILRKIPLGRIQSLSIANNRITLSRNFDENRLGLIQENIEENSNVYVEVGLSTNNILELKAKIVSLHSDFSEPGQPRKVLSVQFEDPLEWSFYNLAGATIFIKRYEDTRRPEDKLYSFIISKRKNSINRIPLGTYIIRKSGANIDDEQPFKLIWNNDHNKGQVYYIDSVKEIKNPDPTKIGTIPDPERDYYEVLVLCGFANKEGDMEFISNLNRGADLSNILKKDPEYVDLSNIYLKEDNPSFVNTRNVTRLLGFDEDIFPISAWNPQTTSRFILGFLAYDAKIDLNKPSVIRCGGQTWEYVGYYNYSTSLPQLQNSIPDGNDLSSVSIKRVSKIQTPKNAGRIYATGMDEFGRFYLGNQILDLTTGQSSEIDFGNIIQAQSPVEFPDYYEYLKVGTLDIENSINFVNNDLIDNSPPVIQSSDELAFLLTEGVYFSIGGERVFTINKDNIPNVVVISSTTPQVRNDFSRLRPGDIWWDSTQGITYIYYTDADSSQWVEIGRKGFDQNALLRIVNGEIDISGTKKFTNIPVNNQINCSSSSYFVRTVNNNTSFTFTEIPPDRVYEMTIELNHISGTVDFPNSVVWGSPSGGSFSIETGEINIYKFMTRDQGNTWYNTYWAHFG